jgi:diguanylate cyclase (GGDEF)-like protein/PAS domain S-box-containing protein
METMQDLIVIVDDAEENLILLKRMLGKGGYNVEVTSNSSEVLQICKTRQPSLVLLDIQMPGMDGFEVCRQLKDEPLTTSIPVIFISAMDSTADRLRGFEAGAVDYIIKPIEFDETLARIRSQLTIYKLQKKLEAVNEELDGRVEELTLSREQVHERENKLSAFIKALPNITIVYDEEGRYLEIYSNETEKIVADVEVMIGKKIGDFISPDVARLILDAIQSVIQTGQTKVIEYQIPVQSGKKLWFEGRIVLMGTAHGGKGKVIFVATEITERIEMYQKIQSLSIMDPTLNCYNRRKFLEMAEQEIARASRYDHPLSLMILDIDHFKQINDSFGHPIGDQVLQQIVDTCRNTIRNTDIFGRYGGDEFVILFPETSMYGAMEIAERLRQKVGQITFQAKDETNTITMSGGLACLESMGNKNVKLESFIEEADKALYHAKAEGRNRIHTNCQGYPIHLIKKTNAVQRSK